MSTMKVNIATLQTAHNQLQTVRSDLNKLLSRFSQVRRQLEDTWDGAAAQAYVNMLAEERINGERVLHQVELLLGYISSTIRKMEEYDRNWAAKLKELAEEAARRLAEMTQSATQSNNAPKAPAQQNPAAPSSPGTLGGRIGSLGMR